MKKLFKFIFKTVLVVVILVIGLIAFVVIRQISKDDKQESYNVVDNEYEHYDYSVENNNEVIEVEQDSSDESQIEVKEETETEVIEETNVEEVNVGDNDIRPEFKKTMESYEEFFDEYIEFMSSFKQEDASLTTLAKYAEFLTKYEKAMTELGSVDESQLTKAEDKLFLETQLRINNKLAEAAINY